MKLAVSSTIIPHPNAVINVELGGNLNAASRQALMQKLARTEPTVSLPEPAYVVSTRYSFV